MMSDERGSAMMTEFWWKVFLAGVLTAIVAKLFHCPLNFPSLFFFASIGWAALWLLWLLAARWLEERKR